MQIEKIQYYFWPIPSLEWRRSPVNRLVTISWLCWRLRILYWHSSMDKNFDLDVKIDETHAFIQWKGTDVCFDFYCDCGAQSHFDGYSAYTYECPKCKTVWQMPSHLFPRKADERTNEYQKNNPVTELDWEEEYWR